MPPLIKKPAEMKWEPNRRLVWHSQSKRVLCEVCGPLAIYPAAFPGQRAWVLCHWSSTRMIFHAPDKVSVLRVAEAIHRHCKFAFGADKVADVLVRLPAWVKPWLTDCNRQEGYLDPKPYMEASE